MEILLPKAGSYVVAVSGGVDSVALLNILQGQPGLRLSVAHFDHGMRPDSAKDRRFVESLAKAYGLPFVYENGDLGVTASEATARKARYEFLRRAQQTANAQAIITAHHQDDVLETAIINMLRGTGRKGLSALQNQKDINRPLLSVPKQEILDFAVANKLAWREDETNNDTDYLRNYVRQKIVPKFDSESRQELLNIINQTRKINHELDTLLVKQLASQSVNNQLDRYFLTRLSHAMALEVMAAWLRAQRVTNFDKKTLERLVIAAKTASPGQSFPVIGGYAMRVEKQSLALQAPER
jgi:tRNA(Ile)-lysidine synthase